MSVSFRHSAGFGKRMEYKLIGDMLMEGLDCYVPLVDDHGVDCIIKKSDGTFIEVQIKARSKTVKQGDAALFAAITHERRPNFYFVFISERLDNTMWIMSSEEFLKECVNLKNGNHNIKFNGHRTNKATKEKEEYCNPKYDKYIHKDFSIFH